MRKKCLVAILLGSLSVMSGRVLAEGPTTQPATQPKVEAATQPSTRPNAAPANTTAVKRGSLSLTIDSQGSFEPIDSFEVRIRPKSYSGELTITSIIANGSSVKKGDTLLEIDPVVIKRMIAASDNELLSTKAALSKAEADAKISDEADALAMQQQKAALKESDDALKWFENADGPQFLKLIDLSLQQMQDQVKDAQDELDQLKKMYHSEELTNATADIVVRRAVRNLEVSKELLAISQERAKKGQTFTYPLLRQRYLDGYALAKQQFALFETTQTQQKVQRQTGLAGIRAAAAASELRNSELKADLEKLTVAAPEDGIVSYGQIVQGNWQGGDPKALKVGEHVTAQAVIMTLYEPGKLHILLDLPESRYFAIKSGQKASVSPVAFPEVKYEGLCEPGQRTPIGGMGGASYALHIATGEVDQRLVPGMKATVHMEVPLVSDVLLAPMTSVANSTVTVKSADGKEESRHVLTGRSDGKSIEILSGLKEGEQVLTQAKPAN